MNKVLRKIDKMRNKKGWTVYKFAKETGLNAQTIHNWYENNTVASVTAIQQICETFNITLAEFFSDGELVELTPEIKNHISNWKSLNKEQ